MKRKNHLFEHVAEFGNLRESALRAARSHRQNHAVATFLLDLESEALKLERELQQETYEPGGYHNFWIYDQKPRMISAAPFRDRVVHHAICRAIEPTLESFSIYDSYACRVEKGTHRAIVRAQEWSRQGGFALHLDVQKFFMSIDREVLTQQLHRKFKDKKLLRLLRKIIHTSPCDAWVGKGLPIGNLTSQHWANFYLGHLDHFAKEELRIKRYMRYMDDIWLWSDNKDELWSWKTKLTEFLSTRLLLNWNEKRTWLVPISEGVAVLGWRIWPNLIRLSASTKQKFFQRCRSRFRQWQAGVISESMWLRSIHSLVGHISHAQTNRMCATFFSSGFFLLGEEKRETT